MNVNVDAGGTVKQYLTFGHKLYHHMDSVQTQTPRCSLKEANEQEKLAKSRGIEGGTEALSVVLKHTAERSLKTQSISCGLNVPLFTG